MDTTTRVDRWDGNLSYMANEFVINGPFNPTELSITYYSPYEIVNVTNIRVKVHELQKDTWQVPQIDFILKLFLMLLVLAILYKIVFL